MIATHSFSPIQAARHFSNGVSDAAAVTVRLWHDGTQNLVQTEFIGAPLRDTLRELARVSDECSEDGWDGEGALGVGPDVVTTASEILNALPFDLPRPEVSGDPRGFVRLEWFGTRQNILSLVVNSLNSFHFAARINDDREWGSATFKGALSHRIVRLIAEAVT